MLDRLNDRAKSILIKSTDTILSALKRMDALDRKLLIVTRDNHFFGLLSIGDIQRAIIQNKPLDTLINNILRIDITVARSTDDRNFIRMKMIEQRIECMPVINEDQYLEDVIFWEDIISGDIMLHDEINAPVVIMAGGEGKRLRPLTSVLPKPLIPVGDQTIIEKIMGNFFKNGCNEFYISVNYKAEMIKHYLLSLNNPSYQLHFFQEEKPLGTAGSLYLLEDKISTTFFVTNCDIIVNQNLTEVYKYHKENNNKITIVAALKHQVIPYGTIKSGNNGLLTSLSEKPEIIFKINSGIYVLEPGILSLIPKGRFFHLTDLIIKAKKRKERVGVFPVSERSWLDYGLLENLSLFNMHNQVPKT
jgi:dTDP-glucose pyrophosphorylase